MDWDQKPSQAAKPFVPVAWYAKNKARFYPIFRQNTAVPREDDDTSETNSDVTFAGTAKFFAGNKANDQSQEKSNDAGPSGRSSSSRVQCVVIIVLASVIVAGIIVVPIVVTQVIKNIQSAGSAVKTVSNEAQPTAITNTSPDSSIASTTMFANTSSTDSSNAIQKKTSAASLEGTVRITNVEYSDDLIDSQSESFKKLERLTCQQLKELTSNTDLSQYYQGCEIAQFTKGSVIAHFTLHLVPGLDEALLEKAKIILLKSFTNKAAIEAEANALLFDPISFDFKTDPPKQTEFKTTPAADLKPDGLAKDIIQTILVFLKGSAKISNLEYSEGLSRSDSLEFKSFQQLVCQQLIKLPLMTAIAPNYKDCTIQTITEGDNMANFIITLAPVPFESTDDLLAKAKQTFVEYFITSHTEGSNAVLALSPISLSLDPDIKDISSTKFPNVPGVKMGNVEESAEGSQITPVLLIGVVRITNLEFNDALYDSQSIEFHKYEKLLCSELKEVALNRGLSDNYGSCSVVKFAVNVVTTFVIELEPRVTDASDILLDKAKRIFMDYLTGQSDQSSSPNFLRFDSSSVNLHGDSFEEQSPSQPPQKIQKNVNENPSEQILDSKVALKCTVRITNLEYIATLSNSQSMEFQKYANQICEGLKRSALESSSLVSGSYRGCIVTEFIQEKEGVSTVFIIDLNVRTSDAVDDVFEAATKTFTDYLSKTSSTSSTQSDSFFLFDPSSVAITRGDVSTTDAIRAKVSATSGCGTTFLTASQGSITSPNYPSSYLSNTDCYYTISLIGSTSISFAFSGAYSMESCCDWVKIDASNCQPGGIYTYTGSTRPTTSVSFSSCSQQVQVQFHSDVSVQYSGYNLTYTVGGCGATYLTASQGIITSSGYPTSYQPNTDCLYTIASDTFNIISISFSQTFWLESCCDYVKVNASNCLGGSINTYTGSNSPPASIFSSCRQIQIQFHSSPSVQGAGFRLNYTIGGCGVISFTGPQGIITSPNFPNAYQPNTDCLYTIALPSSTVITLTFSQTFGLESCCDRLQVDASACQGGSIYTYTGSTVPSTLVFPSCNYIQVRFHSDSSVQYAGFSINYTTGGCGPTYFTGTQGIVSSPNYPLGYLSNIDCLYTIASDTYNIISIFFSPTFWLESCCDYVKVNASNCLGGTVNTYTGSNTPPALIFPSCRQIQIQFHSSPSVQGAGFSLNYTTGGCGVTSFTGPQGIITSPNFPNAYKPNTDCLYTIALPNNTVISLTFSQTFSLESCCDSVQVNASACQGGSINTYTGSTAPPAVSFSSCKLIQIRFRSDGSVEGAGFSLSYTTAGCGLTAYTGTQGSIVSPNYPTSYPSSTDCVYTISWSGNTAVSLVFNSLFWLESCCDFIAVNASSCQGGSSYTYTGSVAPASLSFSSCSQIRIQFHSSASVQGAGFRVNYTTGGCGATSFTASRGTITSPNYPSSYLSYTDCFYTITLNSTSDVSLAFSPTFFLEQCCDYVKVNCFGGSIFTYTGYSAPSTLLLTSCRLVQIQFHSDGSVEGAGFRIDYTAAAGNSSTTLSTRPPTTLAPGCGVTSFSGPQGTISSPNYPNDYLPYTNCLYTITWAYTDAITVTFSPTFYLESCCDYVQIDASSCQGGVYRYTGYSAPSPIVLPSCSQVLVTFHSDVSVQGSGFRLNYTRGGTLASSRAVTTIRPTSYIPQGCGANTFYGPQGNISSPNYPNNYLSYTDCYYTINWSYSSSSIVLVFSSPFYLEPCCDYVQVNASSCQGGIYSFTGSAVPSQLTIPPCSQVQIRFHSDGSVEGAGFRLSYSRGADWTSPTPIPTTTHISGCGASSFTGASGTISSPNYPNSYLPNTDCTYTIVLNRVTGVSITFAQSFWLESGWDSLTITATNCQNGGVYAYAGATAPSPLSFVSCSQNIRIQFHSDGSVQGVGFRFNYSTEATTFQPTTTNNVQTTTSVPPGCGRTSYTGSQGTITSPNYPNNYLPYTSCFYTISLNSTTSISLVFAQTFWVETGYDYVKVNATNCQGGTVYTFAGYTAPAPLYFSSCSRTIQIQFSSDVIVQGPGFSLTYTTGVNLTVATSPRPTAGTTLPPQATSVPGCGPSSYTGTQGTITSPNYPNSYLPNTDCVYTISWASNTAISLVFSTTFWLESGYDYIRINASSCQGGGVSTYTSSIAPDPLSFSSCSQNIQILFHSDSIVQGSGFSLTYTLGGCGATSYTGIQGVITSPNYPSNYLSNTDCSYSISLGGYTSITLVFNSTFALESCCDYVKINATNCQGGAVYTYTGETAPSSISFNSCHQNIQILFHTDGSVVSAGFRLNYTLGLGGCGASYYYGPQGTISSPNYPNSYPQSTDCSYQLIWSYSTPITLAFSQPFWLESCCDYILVDASSCKIGIYLITGTTIPASITIPACYQIQIRFHSDVSVQGAGFMLNYLSGNQSLTTTSPTTTTQPSPTPFTGCGSTYFYGNHGTITSPNYPSSYPPNTNCSYIINAIANTSVSLSFEQSFWVESGYDYVKINASGCQGGGIYTFAGYTAPAPLYFSSCSRNIQIQFYSDNIVQGVGFSLTYTTGCGKTIFNESQGIISSPNYPYAYLSNTDCYYTINWIYNSTMTLAFNQLFGMESCCDYISIDASSCQGGAYYSYTGSTVPTSIVLPSCYQFRLHFHSDSSIEGVGFQLNYSRGGNVSSLTTPRTTTTTTVSPPSSGCGRTSFNESQGIISSPNYPNAYLSYTDCYYTINWIYNSTITFAFSQLFWIEYGYDYITIDASSCQGGAYYSYTGSTAPTPIVLPSCYQFRLHFHSDGSVVGVGFQLNYSRGGNLSSFTTSRTTTVSPPTSGIVMNAGCGRTSFNESQGIIASPNYPNVYLYNTDCYYTINWIYNSTITFAFNPLYGMESCCDYVSIDASSCQGGAYSYTGSTVPTPIVLPPCNQFRLHFHSDHSVQDVGFQLNYSRGGNLTSVTTVRPPTPTPTFYFAGCGPSNFTGPAGIISSPNYPNTYQPNTDCLYTISWNYSSSIMISFTQPFYLESCCDYVVINASSCQGPVSTLTGTSLPDPIFLPPCPSIQIRFHSDSSVQGAGFSFYFSKSGCDNGMLNGSQGIISSPNYPNSYPAWSDCTYTIIWSYSYPISFSFARPFLLEGCCDYVQVNASSCGGGVYSLTGPSVPTSFTLPPCPSYTVRFHADGSVQGAGFSLNYSRGSTPTNMTLYQPSTTGSPVWFTGGDCGKSKYSDAGEYYLPDPRIVGGVNARPYEFPWQVSLRASGLHFCGGVIINERWILTAAHCSVAYSASSMTVVVGEYQRSVASTVRQVLGVQTIYTHPKYVTAWRGSDIALMRLSGTISLNENVWPVCPPDPIDTYVNRKCQCSGWGTIYSGASYCPDILEYTTMNITTSAYCQSSYSPAYQIGKDMICATDNLGNTQRDSCQGDSGGPLTVKNSKGVFSLVGLVSFGTGCASSYPGVYARTGSFLDWISSTIY